MKLEAFKKLYGPYWKSYLRAAWAGEIYRGVRPNDIRNKYGPTWLHNLRLPL